jgi:acyl-CoA synthetase (NDP forming)
MGSSAATVSASPRSLQRLFAPRGIAFAGASEKAEGYGARIIRYCLEGGFEGDMGFVNPRYDRLFGRRCHASLLEVPGDVDVVIAMVGPARMMELYAAAAERGAGYVVVIGDLFHGDDAAQQRQKRELRERIDAGGPRIVGPVCVGVLAPPQRLSMSISSTLVAGPPRAGGIGLVSQSGGIISAVIDRARLSGAGFSCIVSSGGEFDLGLCDYVEHLVADASTRVIAVYCEGIGDAERFLGLASSARRADKPILLLKAGTSEVGAKAALSHSGRIMGDSILEAAVLRRHGVVLVEDIDDLHVTATVLARCRVNPGTGIAAASLSGGYSVVVGDALARAGLPVAELVEETCARLRNDVAQPRPSNPLDAGARPTPGREALDVRASLDALDADPAVGLTLYAETSFLNPETVVEPLAQFTATARKPHLTCWQGGPAMAPVVAALRERGVIVIESLAQTIAALRALHAWCAPIDESPALPSTARAEWLVHEPAGTLEPALARRL